MLQKLINSNQIEIFFQPIISIKDKKIFAYEALTRAYDDSGELIMPLFLFKQAKKENLSNLLDAHVRKLAIIKFKEYYDNDESVLLFLNVESSFVEDSCSDEFIKFVQQHKINPANIIIEIKEDAIKSNSLLEDFITKYRKNNFLIAIDDFGTGYSSFDRLALVKPDIVKIDRSIIYNINQNFINSEILNAIVNMCSKIGSMVLAEGVETQNEVLHSLSKGIDIYQGFWFSKAKRTITKELNEAIVEQIKDTSSKHIKAIKTDLYNKEMLLNSATSLSFKVLEILDNSSLHTIKRLEKIIETEEKLEAIYLLDELNALQVGNTIIDLNQNRKIYTATKNYHDHTLSEYYYMPKESIKGEYLSDRYVSKASGNMCRTYSKKISLNNFKYIVCFDILD